MYNNYASDIEFKYYTHAFFTSKQMFSTEHFGDNVFFVLYGAVQILVYEVLSVGVVRDFKL